MLRMLRNTRRIALSRKLQASIGGGGIILLGLISALGLNAPYFGEVNAQSANKCNLKTIKGTYLFEARGVVRDGQKVQPYAEAGTWTLDGVGHAEGVFSASIDGTVIANQTSFTATYQLKSGCVFTALAPVGDQQVEFHLYTNEQGSIITYFSPGVSGTQFKR